MSTYEVCESSSFSSILSVAMVYENLQTRTGFIIGPTVYIMVNEFMKIFIHSGYSGQFRNGIKIK